MQPEKTPSLALRGEEASEEEGHCLRTRTAKRTNQNSLTRHWKEASIGWRKSKQRIKGRNSQGYCRNEQWGVAEANWEGQ